MEKQIKGDACEMSEEKQAHPAHPHYGHRERVRNLFLKSGLAGFSDHNVLELLLFYTIPKSDTNLIAHRLIDRFGSLAGVLDASPEELCEVYGDVFNDPAAVGAPLLRRRDRAAADV